MISDILNWVIAFVASVDPVTRTLVAGLAIMLETSFLVGLIMPGDTVVLVASTGIQNTEQYVFMLIAVVVGALIGETIGFYLGRFFGTRLRRSRAGQWIGEERWREANNFVHRRGGLAVFFSRFLPFFHSVVPLTAGMAGMRYRTFITWTTAACVIWASIYVSIAYFLTEQYLALAERFDWAAWAFIGIVIVLIVVSSLIKKRLERSQEKFMHADDDTKTGTPSASDS
ncbi:MAG: DedA family protein [Actinobacteria bacterium]|nr:DedA family protein [Actinomycetota bacterium]